MKSLHLIRNYDIHRFCHNAQSLTMINETIGVRDINPLVCVFIEDESHCFTHLRLKLNQL